MTIRNFIIRFSALVIMCAVALQAAGGILGGGTSWSIAPPPPPTSSGDQTVGFLTQPGSGTNFSDGWANWSIAGMKAIPFTASIATSGTMTVTVTSSLALGPSQAISGAGIANGTTITAFGSGVGGTGTYTVSPAPSSAISSEAMMAAGIPNRTTQYGSTLTPNGTDDTSQINTAISGCPTGDFVLLSTGVFKVSGNGITAGTSGCTLRGSGPGSQLNTGINPVGYTPAITITSPSPEGCTALGSQATTDQYCADATATQIVRIDRASSSSQENIQAGGSGVNFGTSHNLSVDAVQGAYSITLSSTPSGISVGDRVWVDEDTFNNGGDPLVNWGYSFVADTAQYNQVGYGCRGTYHSIADIYEVAAISGATITFTTPITYSYHTANTAQLTIVTGFKSGIGVENIFVWGGMKGNVIFNSCAYCWMKNAELAWGEGRNILIYQGFHNEVRDSFVHETPTPNPGGGGYMMTLEGGTAETLMENNISWFGNKVNTMECAGGGNVYAYNYTDDSLDSEDPAGQEAGINASHMTTVHLTLLEGNYSPNLTGDAYWGPAIFTTFFRNWASGSRAGHFPFSTYSETQTCNGAPIFYTDSGNVGYVDLQAFSLYQNFIGNVLGSYNHQLAGSNCNGPAQSGFTQQIYTLAQWNAQGNNNYGIETWSIGRNQATGNAPSSTSYVPADCPGQAPQTVPNWTFDNCTINTVTRTASWEWWNGTNNTTGVETCYDLNAGQGGTTNQGCSGVTVPNSFYLSAKPAFFGAHPWPWVSPTTGTTSGGSGSSEVLLPAMYCFQNGNGGRGAMPTCALP